MVISPCLATRLLRISVYIVFGLALSSCAVQRSDSQLLASRENYSDLVKAFGSLPLISSIKLSPSGRYMAILINGETGTGLVTREVDGTDEHVVLSTDNQRFRFRYFDWVTDERLIIGVLFPDYREGNGRSIVGIVSFSGGGVETSETRLLSVSRDGKEIKTDLIPRTFFWKSHSCAAVSRSCHQHPAWVTARAHLTQHLGALSSRLSAERHYRRDERDRGKPPTHYDVDRGSTRRGTSRCRAGRFFIHGHRQRSIHREMA
jgi:hypothetical protein